MIPYEDINNHDGRMYWNNGIVFVVDGDLDVYPYRLSVAQSDGNHAFESSTHLLMPLRDTDAEPEAVRRPPVEVTGRELFDSPRYIMHRQPVEYITPDGSKLIRVCGETGQRRAFKGTAIEYFNPLPVLEIPDDTFDHVDPESAAGRAIGRLTMAVNQGALPNRRVGMAFGIAKVLSIGAPNSMRRLVASDAVTDRAKDAVRNMFNSSETVVVPDFPVAVVKHRNDARKAYVLYRGKFIGELTCPRTRLTYTPHIDRALDERSAKAYVRGLESLANRLFADAIERSKTF